MGLSKFQVFDTWVSHVQKTFIQKVLLFAEQTNTWTIVKAILERVHPPHEVCISTTDHMDMIIPLCPASISYPNHSSIVSLVHWSIYRKYQIVGQLPQSGSSPLAAGYKKEG